MEVLCGREVCKKLFSGCCDADTGEYARFQGSGGVGGQFTRLYAGI